MFIRQPSGICRFELAFLTADASTQDREHLDTPDAWMIRSFAVEVQITSRTLRAHRRGAMAGGAPPRAAEYSSGNAPQTQPVGLGRPAILHACLAGP